MSLTDCCISATSASADVNVIAVGKFGLPNPIPNLFCVVGLTARCSLQEHVVQCLAPYYFTVQEEPSLKSGTINAT